MQHKHKHRHANTDTSADNDGRNIVLVGNPNVGKSVIFGYLTGTYADVSNYPGTTIEIMSGKCGNDNIIDTPGIYGVSSFNDEERVASEIILNADIIINVVDSIHLERDLFLTLQLADMGFPMIIALNFMDDAKREGIEIDVDLLSDLIGVPIIPTTATNKAGLKELKESIDKARAGYIHPEIADMVNLSIRTVGTRREAILLLEGDEPTASRHGIPPGTMREELYLFRRNRVNDLIDHVVKEIAIGKRLSATLGDLTLKPISGIIILAVILVLLYKIIGVYLAQNIVGFTENTIMREHWEPMIRNIIHSTSFAPKGSAIGEILVGEFGVLTMSITYLFGLLLPLVLGFYITLSILEDSGYLPRLAVLTDRLLSGIGLNGRAVIPIILGFGCITMATVTTRLLGSEREKTIAASILNFTIPCSAQIGIITLLLGRIGLSYTIAFILIIGFCFVLVGTVLHKSLPGESTSLLINLPSMRLPRFDNVIRKSMNKTGSFMKEAYPWFIGGSFVVAVMQVTGYLYKIQKLFEPLTVKWLQLPIEAANAFVMGMVRRDFGAAGFANMSLNHPQTLVAMVSMTLFVPCVASVAILLKERSTKEAVAIWFGTWIAAFLVGGIVSQIII